MAIATVARPACQCQAHLTGAPLCLAGRGSALFQRKGRAGRAQTRPAMVNCGKSEHQLSALQMMSALKNKARARASAWASASASLGTGGKRRLPKLNCREKCRCAWKAKMLLRAASHMRNATLCHHLIMGGRTARQSGIQRRPGHVAAGADEQ